MREIKFRGKRLDNGEWLYGSLLVSHFKDDKKERYFITQFSGNYTFEHEVDPATIGQFTGLKDKNGRDIWEGDIFKEDGSGIVRSVFRVPGGLAFEDNPVSFGYDHRAPVYPYSSIAETQSASWLFQCCEVIGNIHDDPELLKTE
ncbi:YopX family protein [uncultured Parabacteroides sp.]|uniref:YopX family protein n=1 Tax=uncultured Parabacteroides sp. TaxID=512312 RepID=UPI0026144A96|nr:YopX family protein [uncultured Parabacteroides sp.]